MNIEEIKALGAPFRDAEVQISLREKIVRLVLVIREHDNPAIDLPWYGSDDVEQLGREVFAAAWQKGLVNGQTTLTIVDLDHLADTAS